MPEKKATSLTEAEAEGRTGDMHRRSVIYAPGGIIGVHISLKITGGCQCREPMWCSKSFTSPPAPSMVTRNVILSVSEESGEEGRDNGPRTSQICILLKYRFLQKSIVRGPHFFEGTANKVILHCIVFQWITKS